MRILYVTTISLTINAFFKPHIKMLVDEGHRVDIATNTRDLPLDESYNNWGCNFFQIDFSRSPISRDNIRAYRQLKKLVLSEKYDIVHCHTPNASVVTRLACRKIRKKNGLKVFYTAHGFHFYSGAPIKNWLVYYPVEWLASFFTDVLITINKEDHERSQRHMHAMKNVYIPGVGIDLARFKCIDFDRAKKRRELGLSLNSFVFLSVGELNHNKNHELMIRALAGYEYKNIEYVIAGQGELFNYLTGLAKELGVGDRVHLLGFRTDVGELYAASDAYVLPSLREGLNVSVMEAMAAGLPVLCARIRGNVDMVSQDNLLFTSNSIDDLKRAVGYVLNSDIERLGEINSGKADVYRKEVIIRRIIELYVDK